MRQDQDDKAMHVSKKPERGVERGASLILKKMTANVGRTML
jgi:hypothetical protein